MKVLVLEDGITGEFSGTIDLKVLETTEHEYKVLCTGLTDEEFNFSISIAKGSEIEQTEEGEVYIFAPEKVCLYLMNASLTSSAPYEIEAGSQTIEFTKLSHKKGVHKVEVSGNFKAIHLGFKENTDLAITRIEGINNYNYNTDIQSENEAPDPADVFRHLMELLKKMLCPECL